MPQKTMTPVVGILLGNTNTSEKAAEMAETFRPCPYCVSYQSSGNTLIGVFVIPEDHKWWLESVAENPEGTMSLKSAEAFFPEAIDASSPWSRGEVEPILEQAPCSAECQKCPVYENPCQGCPSTRDYIGR